MKKKTYKAMKNRLYCEHKAWVIEKEKRQSAEDRIQAMEEMAKKYQQRFRQIGSNVETIDPGDSAVKMLKWTIQTQQWGNYIVFDSALIDQMEEGALEKKLKEELVRRIAEALLENDIVQYIIREPDLIPINAYGTFGGKLYVVPWEYMANRSKTIELMQKAEDEQGKPL